MINPAQISITTPDATKPIGKKFGETFCPGILHAVPARDGLLMRIRVPGGLIDAHQLRTIAQLSAAYADGTIEITSRANLQIRAIQQADLGTIAERLAAAGLLPSVDHDRVRNIVSSPLAGLDPSEILDPRPYLHELDRKLSANSPFAQIHPKFSFGIFGGPARFSPDADDLALEAISTSEFRLDIAGNAFLVPRARAVDTLLKAAENCIEIAHQHNIPVRVRKIVEIPGAAERIAPTPRRFEGEGLQSRRNEEPKDAALAAEVLPSAAPTPPPIDAPIGTCPTSHPNLINIIPTIPLGRLTAHQAISIAALPGIDLRLAPWRGIVLGAIPLEAVPGITSALHAIGLSCTGHNGFHGVSACAGITGCEAALADVRTHAASLAELLEGRPVPAGWTVNLSACDKQCARRHGAAIDLIAYPSGYTLKRSGQIAAVNLTPAAALQAIAASYPEAPQ